MVLLEGFTALEVCILIGLVGFIGICGLCVIGYIAWVLISMSQAWLYAHNDRWIDRTRNRVTDIVDSDTEE